jgi:hypothetical protein
MGMRRMPLLALAAALAVPCLTGCPAAPRARPVEAGPVDTGPGSVEWVRRQLKGTWQLVSLDVYTADGQKHTAQAAGTLTYDEYGNLAIRGKITGGEKIEKANLNLTGRATIDPNTHMLRVGGVKADTPDARRLDPKLDPDHVRYYEFDGELLKTTTKNASGVTTATVTWKKVG